jgi:hypothetical protein
MTGSDPRKCRPPKDQFTLRFFSQSIVYTCISFAAKTLYIGFSIIYFTKKMRLDDRDCGKNRESLGEIKYWHEFTVQWVYLIFTVL